jgi:hypothetical protein
VADNAPKDPNEEIWAKHPVTEQPKRMLRKKFELLHGADSAWEEVDAPASDVPTGIVRHPDLPAAPRESQPEQRAVTAPAAGQQTPGKDETKESAR